MYTNKEQIVLLGSSPHVSYFGFKFQMRMVNLEMQEMLEQLGSTLRKERVT